eukprot:1181061-Prorocentrum_minimum.AAC.2
MHARAPGGQQVVSRGSMGGQQGVNRGSAGGQQGVSRGSIGGQQGVNRGSAGGHQGVSRGSAGANVPVAKCRYHALQLPWTDVSADGIVHLRGFRQASPRVIRFGSAAVRKRLDG